MNKCRDCYVELETAAQFIPDQVPTTETRVQNLLTSIDGCTDPSIVAARLEIRDQTAINKKEYLRLEENMV